MGVKKDGSQYVSASNSVCKNVCCNNTEKRKSLLIISISKDP